MSAARAFTLELVKTEKVGREALAPVAAIGKNFSAMLGLDAIEGGQTLARIFAEPSKALETAQVAAFELGGGDGGGPRAEDRGGTRGSPISHRA